MRGRSASLGLAAACAVLCAVPAAASPVTATATFGSPGSYTFTVPAGVTSIAVIATGAPGGHVGVNAGGQGAAVAATVPVSGGEQLVVGVGGVGGDGGLSIGAGGIGGGGPGNSSLGSGSAGGGGASLVGTASASPAFGLLVVAGGGGGAGGAEAGGTAGSAGAGGGVSGGSGTRAGGGAGGSSDGSSGASGSFGLGGQGGSGVTEAGGGGGGGYFGGGGGGGGTLGGGGGGGSSFVTAQATNVNGPTPTGNAPGVTITYAAPLAGESAQSIAFPAGQPQGVASAAQTLTVTNDGSAPLVVSAVELGGADPADYLLDDGCQQQVAPGASCAVAIRFAPQALGPSSATLTLVTNAVAAPPAVALSGTGGTSPAGPAGPAGATGPSGPAGTPGAVELVRCHTVTKTVTRHHRKVRVAQQQCSTKTVTGTAKFTTTAASEHATLSRGGVLYASGGPGASGVLVLRERRALAPGTYTLTLRTRRGTRVQTTRRRVTVT